MLYRSTKNGSESDKNSDFYIKFEIPWDNFEIVQDTPIGSGSYSKIYKVKDKNNKIYAAKVLTNNTIEEIVSQIVQEIDSLILFQHPTIIRFYGYSPKDFNSREYYTIFMDYAEKGSLEKYIKDDILDNTARQIILIGIAYGMMHIHKKNILHLDLKPHNILLDENYYPHIADFGVSQKIESNIPIKEAKGSSAYMAPEVIIGDPLGPKADVYSFGILMFEVVSRRKAYRKNLTTAKLNNMVVNDKYRPKFNHGTKKSIKTLIKRCWSPEPSIRPTFEEIFCRLSENNKPFKFDIFRGNYGDNNNEYEEEDESDLDANMKSETANDDSFTDEHSTRTEDEKDRTIEYHLAGVDMNRVREYIKIITESEKQESDIDSASNSTELNLSGYHIQSDPRRIKPSEDEEKTKTTQKPNSLQKICEELEKQLHDQKIEYENMLSEQEVAFTAKLNILKDENEKKRKQIGNLKTTNQINTEKLVSLQKEKEDLTERFEALQEQYEAVVNEDKDKAEQLKNLNENKRLLIEKNAKKLKQNVNLLKAEKEEITTKYDDLLNEYQELIIKLNDKDNQINNLEVANQSLNKRLDKYKQSDEKLFESNQNLRDQIKQFQIEINNSKLELENNTKMINNLRKEIDEKTNLIEKLQTEKTKFNDLQLENQNLQKEIQENLIRLENLENDKTELTLNNESISKDVFELGCENRQLNQFKEDIEIQLNNLKKENLLLRQKHKSKTSIIVKKIKSSLSEDFFKVKNNNEIFIHSFLDGFNSLDLRSQNIFLESVIKNSESLKLKLVLTNLKNLLAYLSNMANIPLNLNLIQIFADETSNKPNSNSLDQIISNLNQIHMFSELTDFLYLNGILNRTEFYSLTDKFNFVVVEIAKRKSDDQADHFENIYELVISKMRNATISVFITGFRETDQYFKNNKQINLVRFDTTVTIIKGGFLSGSFASCTSLKMISIPPSVTFIGCSSFSCCTSLTKVVIPSSVRVIDSHAFHGCSKLREIVLQNEVASIGSHCFMCCSSLCAIKIPTSLTSIGRQTFYDCTSLTSILIPCGIARIEEEAFCGCTNLKSVKFASPSADLNKDESRLVIEKGAFRCCNEIEQLKFPSHLGSIESLAFDDCKKLIAMKFRSATCSIGKKAFFNCPVKEITVPAAMEKMFKKTKELGIKNKVEVYTE